MFLSNSILYCFTWTAINFLIWTSSLFILQSFILINSISLCFDPWIFCHPLTNLFPRVDERYHISKVGPVFSEKWLRHATDTVITCYNIADSNCSFDCFPQLKNLSLKYEFPTCIWSYQVRWLIFKENYVICSIQIYF